MKLALTLSIAATALLAACTTTGNIERNAAGGAVLGGLAGAVIGNNVGSGNAGDGAAIGAVLGGAAGAVRGDMQDQKLAKCRSTRPEQLYRDSQGRSYYGVPNSNTTCWRNGTVRS